MSATGTCPACGMELPCACARAGDAARALTPLSLLPCPGELEVEEEERFTRLLREVKANVVARGFLGDGDARPLLVRARRLERLIEEGRLRDADAAASRCLARVLDFPRRRRLVRWWLVALFLVVAFGVVGIGGLTWLLIQ